MYLKFQESTLNNVEVRKCYTDAGNAEFAVKGPSNV